MRGKLVEDTKTVIMHRAKQLVAAAATYGTAVDTLGFSSAVIELNVGTCPVGVTLGAHLFEGDENNPALMVQVTGGAFPLITAASNDARVHVGALNTQDHKRFISVRLMPGGVGSPTINAAVNCVLGKASDMPTSQTAAFDID